MQLEELYLPIGVPDLENKNNTKNKKKRIFVNNILSYLIILK